MQICSFRDDYISLSHYNVTMQNILMLYHGSEAIRQMPVSGQGNTHNDYGLGFYCTESIELAKEWACAERRGGFANRYSMDLSDLKVLNLNSPDYHILNWLAILLENRSFDLRAVFARQAKEYILDHFLPDYAQYDIIIGYRADDSYFSFTRAFLENLISLEQLQRAMHLGKLGEQVVLKSQQAFARIRFEKAEYADAGVYFALRQKRDRQAREDYYKLQAEPAVADAVYAIDILRQNWQNDDQRLY